MWSCLPRSRSLPRLPSSLDRAQGDAYVNLLQPDGTLLEIPVTLGLQGQDVSQVSAGLTEGDVIAVDLAGDSLSIFGG